MDEDEQEIPEDPEDVTRTEFVRLITQASENPSDEGIRNQLAALMGLGAQPTSERIEQLRPQLRLIQQLVAGTVANSDDDFDDDDDDAMFDEDAFEDQFRQNMEARLGNDHKLWLVRWGDTAQSVSIVSARDANDLYWVLDAEQDADDCVFEPFTEPLHLKFQCKEVPTFNNLSVASLKTVESVPALQRDLAQMLPVESDEAEAKSKFCDVCFVLPGPHEGAEGDSSTPAPAQGECRVYAHRCMLAARCPKLAEVALPFPELTPIPPEYLSAILPQRQSRPSLRNAPVTRPGEPAQLAASCGVKAFRLLLQFIYTGDVSEGPHGYKAVGGDDFQTYVLLATAHLSDIYGARGGVDECLHLLMTRFERSQGYDDALEICATLALAHRILGPSRGPACSLLTAWLVGGLLDWATPHRWHNSDQYAELYARFLELPADAQAEAHAYAAAQRGERINSIPEQTLINILNGRGYVRRTQDMGATDGKEDDTTWACMRVDDRIEAMRRILADGELEVGGSEVLGAAAETDKPELLQFLLSNVRDPTALDKLRASGFAPLHMAVKALLPVNARLLLAAGADVSLRDHKGRTATQLLKHALGKKRALEERRAQAPSEHMARAHLSNFPRMAGLVNRAQQARSDARVRDEVAVEMEVLKVLHAAEVKRRFSGSVEVVAEASGGGGGGDSAPAEHDEDTLCAFCQEPLAGTAPQPQEGPRAKRQRKDSKGTAGGGADAAEGGSEHGGHGGDDSCRCTLRGCGHSFHLACVGSWLIEHQHCPVCRSECLPDASPPETSSQQEARLAAEEAEAMCPGGRSQRLSIGINPKFVREVVPEDGGIMAALELLPMANTFETENRIKQFMFPSLYAAIEDPNQRDGLDWGEGGMPVSAIEALVVEDIQRALDTTHANQPLLRRVVPGPAEC